MMSVIVYILISGIILYILLLFFWGLLIRRVIAVHGSVHI